VTCDLACNWKLDGSAKGRIEAGGSSKAKVELGQHVVVATTEDSFDKLENEIEIKAPGQTVVHIALQPVRDARGKAEQEAKDKADQEVRDKAAQEARDKAAQEAKAKSETQQLLEKVIQVSREKAAQEARGKEAQEEQDTITSSTPKSFVPLKAEAEKRRGVWVAGHGSGQFSSVYLELLDFLSTSGVVIANYGLQNVTNTQDVGFMPLSSLIETLPKKGANSLLYIKVEQGEIMLGGYVRASVYFQCFDITGHLLWDEKVISGAVNGADARMNFIMKPGWKRKLTPHIGKPGLLLKAAGGPLINPEKSP
jgi:membrane-associated HD superfamily phosphohydrolase